MQNALATTCAARCTDSKRLKRLDALGAYFDRVPNQNCHKAALIVPGGPVSLVGGEAQMLQHPTPLTLHFCSLKPAKGWLISMSAPTQQLISPARLKASFRATPKTETSKAVIARYAAAMQRGDWMLSNDVICITTDGILLNGQHRMNAVVVSETSQDFWVWEGCPPDAQMVMDMGNKRDAADNATLSVESTSAGTSPKPCGLSKATSLHARFRLQHPGTHRVAPRVGRQHRPRDRNSAHRPPHPRSLHRCGR